MLLSRDKYTIETILFTLAELTDKYDFTIEETDDGYEVIADELNEEAVNEILATNEIKEIIESKTRTATQFMFTRVFEGRDIHPKFVNGFIPRFRFKEWHGRYLVTNDLGFYIIIDSGMFKRMVSQELLPSDKNTLRKSFFYIDQVNWESCKIELQKTWRKYMGGPNTFVLKFTNACNYNCVYCQAGSSNHNKDQMCTVETGKHVVDLMAQAPSKVVVLEIQGGEPLLNWPVIKETVLYAEEQLKHKECRFRMMTNLSLMNDEIYAFCKEHHIDIGTSLDGPKEVHDANRPSCNKESSYDQTQRGRDFVKDKRGFPVGYLTTVTKDSLPHVEEIVNMSLDEQHQYNCRPLFKLGRAIDTFDEIGYTPEEYLKYFKAAVDACINRYLGGDRSANELRTRVFAAKVLEHRNGDIELGTPCGAIQCMVSIDWNGDIMACEGSKMLREPYRSNYVTENVNVPGIKYEDVFFNNKALSILRKTFNEDDAKCSRCVYAPYCGNCAVEREQNKDYTTFNCAINEGMLDNLFQLLHNDTTSPVIREWAKIHQC